MKYKEACIVINVEGKGNKDIKICIKVGARKIGE